MRPTLAPNKEAADRVVRLGLIGAGRWGQAYIRTLADCDGVSLVRIASQNPETKSRVPGACTISTDWQDLIRADDIDGIIIATPPAHHAEIVMAAIKQGHAVMVEKPLTLSLSEAEQLFNAAETHQAITLVDHTHLFHPAYCELKKILSTAGAIREIRTRAGQRGPFRDNISALWDWAPHDIAMCLNLTGQVPNNVMAIKKGTQHFAEGTGEHYELLLEFSGGLKACIKIGNDFPEKTRLLTVLTDTYEYVYDDCATNPLISKPRSGPSVNMPKIINVPKILPLTCAVNEFADKIRRGDMGSESLCLGVDVVRVISQCEESINIG
jgi:predicted dehydrogenase